MLGSHLGPILAQLPPGLHRDDALLTDFLAVFAAKAEKIKKHFAWPWNFAIVAGLTIRCWTSSVPPAQRSAWRICPGWNIRGR